MAKKQIYGQLKRADILSLLGEYSCIVLYFSDTDDLSKEVSGKPALLSTTVHPQSEIKWEYVSGNNQLEKYQVCENEIHPDRYIHICFNANFVPYKGVPYLEPVIDTLYNLMKVIGGSSEMFWLNGRGGLSFEMDKDFRPTPEFKKELTEEADAFNKKLQREVLLHGVKVKPIEFSVPNPTENVNVLTSSLSAYSGIPQRVLLGSEQAQLASTQDIKNFRDRINARITTHSEANILRPFLNRLSKSELSVNPDIEIKWQDLNKITKSEEAAIENKEADTLYKLALAIEKLAKANTTDGSLKKIAEEGFSAIKDMYSKKTQ